MSLAITVCHVFSLAHVRRGASYCYKDKLFRLHFLYERRLYLDTIYAFSQQKRLAIALTLAHQPHLIFLDEPTAALDPRARREIRSLAASGTAIVFTSHNMEEVGKLTDRVVLIVEGRIHAEGKPADLIAQYNVGSLEELYLKLTEEN